MKVTDKVNSDVGAVASNRLLGSDEPPPYQVSSGRNSDWLVVCDHASNLIPKRLGNMGVNETDRFDHIAWDIGAGNVAAAVAQCLDAPLIACNYSRLVIDCNRQPTGVDGIPRISDGRRILANELITPQERGRRLAEIFYPYHGAIASVLDDAILAGQRPVVLSIHTYTARLAEVARPWEIGLSWARDARVSHPMLAALTSIPGLVVGDNEPYKLEIGYDFTIPEHALGRGLAHLQVEFRNDLVSTATNAQCYADKFVSALTSINGEVVTSWAETRSYLTDEETSAGIGRCIERYRAARRSVAETC